MGFMMQTAAERGDPVDRENLYNEYKLASAFITLFKNSTIPSKGPRIVRDGSNFAAWFLG